MRLLVEQLKKLEDRLREGGGPARIERQHRAGKMTARERIAALLDPGAPFLEIGLLVAYDQYDGQAPAAGVVTGIGKIEGRRAVVVANDATVKAGAWWPETITKILRAQEIAMRNRLPIVYLVDSAGVNLPYQDGIFPGQYGAGRIFYYNSLMRRRLRIPQIAAVMGPCIAGGAYLPALSDVIIMVEGVSFMGLGGPNLVKGATGQVIDSESLGGARLHTAVSGVAHYHGRRRRRLPGAHPPALPPAARAARAARPAASLPARSPPTSTACCPPTIACLTTIEEVIWRIFDAGDYAEFQPEYAPEMLCANARLAGRAGGRDRQPPRIPEGPGAAAHRRHHLRRIRAQGGLLRRNQRTAGPSADLPAGRFRFHGGAGSRARGHHPRRRRNGGEPCPAPPCPRLS